MHADDPGVRLAVTTLEHWRGPGSRVPVVGYAGDEAGALELADGCAVDVAVVGLVVRPDHTALEPDPGSEPGGPARELDRAEVVEVRYARRSPSGLHNAFLRRPPTADALDLLPHPEGGWFRETWRSGFAARLEAYGGERSLATAILFLLPPGEESIWHVVRSDELWFWHRGGPLTLALGGTGDGKGDAKGDGAGDGDRPDREPRTLVLGPDLARGQVPQALVPGGTWQAARPATGLEVLVSCVVSPGFDFADFRALP